MLALATMKAAPGIAVILDAEEARGWLSKAPRPERCLASAPDAAAILRGAGCEVIEIEDCVTAFTHARNLVTAERVLAEAQTRLDAADFAPAETRALSVMLFNLIGPVLLLRSALGALPGAPVIVAGDGPEARALGIEDALARLAERLHPPLQRFTNTRYSAAHGRLALWLNRRLAGLWRDRQSILHIDFQNPVPKRLAGMLVAERPELVVLHSRPPANNMAETMRRAVRTVWNGLLPGRGAKGMFVFRASARPLGPPVAGESLAPLYPSDPLLDRIIRAAVAKDLPLVRRENEAGAAFATLPAPSLTVLDNLVFAATVRGARELGARGVRTLLVNHGTHTQPDSRLSALAQRLWARHGRVADPVVTDFIAKTPGTLRLAEEIDPGRPRLHPIAVFPRYARKAPQDGLFRIVIAGNFMAVREHLPWQTETPGEFQRGVIAFAEAAAELDDVELLVKLKAQKSGVSAADLAQLFEGPRFRGQVRVDTSASLGDLFASTDLLVSNQSSTIEEALTSRIPVLLNTWRRSYVHMPARSALPAAGDRAAVYTVAPGQAIAPMLEAIRSAHAGRPLEDPELAGLLWPESEMIGQAELADRLLGPKDGR